MKVCIAEKPSVAREIASVLGAKSRKDGYYEGNGYQVTWTFGHFCTLKEPNDYADQLRRWSLNTLPIIPHKFGIKLINNDGVQKQFGVIKSLVEQAQEVINCGDAGQEGELIQRWVLQKARCQVPVKRLWISSLTEDAIRNGFNQLKPATDFDRLYHAGSSRAIGDWLLGINATRLYTLRFAPKGRVLSIGRVQTPTLAMIVNRHAEVTNFVSVPYWELKTVYRDVQFGAVEGRFEDQAKGESKLAEVKEHEFEITAFEKKKGKESAPKLFDLTSLQVEANKKFNLSADQTLKIAQRLYERKVLTYPRVDTRYLPDDVYAEIPGIMRALTGYSNLTAPLLAQPIRKSKSVFNNKKVTDHHAIIPTNVPAAGLNTEEIQIYDAVAKRFLANFYPECQVSRTTVMGKAGETEFKATGKEILDPGWRVVYGQESVSEETGTGKDKNEEEPQQILPEFQQGETGLHEPFLEQKKTSPPKPFTEATLLRAMETAGRQVDDDEMRELMKENGIGRPSTRAAIIETLFRREYIRKERKRLVPTITGIQLIETIQNDLLKSAELTGSWEKRLRQIETGEYEVPQLMAEMKDLVREVVEQVKRDQQTARLQVEEEPKPKAKAKSTKSKEITCPKCKQGQILQGKQAFGCSAYQSGCDFRIPIEQFGKKLSLNQIKTLVEKGKTSLIKGLLVQDEKQDGFLVAQETWQLSVEVKAPDPLSCPRCKEGQMLKGKSAFGCSRYREGCQTLIPFTHLGKKLTDKQIEDLIRKGKTSKLKGFTDANGQELSGVLTLNANFAIELS